MIWPATNIYRVSCTCVRRGYNSCPLCNKQFGSDTHARTHVICGVTAFARAPCPVLHAFNIPIFSRSSMKRGRTVNKRNTLGQPCYLLQLLTQHRIAQVQYSQTVLIGVDQVGFEKAKTCTCMLSADIPLRLSLRTLATQEKLHISLQASVTCDCDACHIFG